MNREQAREYVKSQLEGYLIDNDIPLNKNFKCPIVEHEHDDIRPGASYNRHKNKVHCFKCNSDFDTFDLIAAETGLSGGELFDYVYGMYRLEVDGKTYDMPERVKAAPQHREPKPAPVPAEEKHYDFTDAVDKASKDDRGRAYYKSRGLTDEIIAEYKLGYINEYNAMLSQYPELQTKSRKQTLYNYILPNMNDDGTCSYFFAEISDRSQIDDYNGKYRKMNANPEADGKVYHHPAQIFNERYIKGKTPAFVFVCEGMYDALSYEVVGHKALAFIGTAHRRFLSLCKQYKPNTHFIITLDNDGAGSDATKKVAEGLQELGISYTMANTATTSKDPNEALKADKEAFQMAVEEAVEEIRNTMTEETNDERDAYLQNSAVNHIQDFIDGIASSVNTEAIKTGFTKLDAILDGGIYEGLYVMGAISSLGKTTFLQQVGDQMAANGNDVLFFSLEMARTELMSKSISRITFLNAADKRNAKTTRGITTGKRYENYSKAETELITKSINDYAEFACNIYITEGMGDVGVIPKKDKGNNDPDSIREVVEKHIRITGKKPVVIVDYLQLLAPNDARSSDKQNTDKAVLELKRISRDFKIPVLAISSFNRMNYENAVSMEAFKESGAIEYSSDVLIGLQLKGIGGEKKFDVNEAKRKDPREIELVILKSRMAQTGGTVDYEYYPKFNYFKEM